MPKDRPNKVPPDWVCETVSGSNASHDTTVKLHKYYLAGVPHYWIVDLRSALLLVYRHEAGGYHKRGALPARPLLEACSDTAARATSRRAPDRWQPRPRQQDAPQAAAPSLSQPAPPARPPANAPGRTCRFRRSRLDGPAVPLRDAALDGGPLVAGAAPRLQAADPGEVGARTVEELVQGLARDLRLAGAAGGGRALQAIGAGLVEQDLGAGRERKLHT